MPQRTELLPTGYEMTITPQPWISVSERLPEVQQNVLAAVAGEVGIAHRYVDGWFWDVDEWSRPFTPTHWMPLPEPPALCP
jgi:hypothetical protein